MSDKEYAMTLINLLTTEQLEALIDFLSTIIDRATIAKLESLALENNPNPKLYDSFGEALKDMEQESE